MLPRSERLSRSDFELLKKRGARIHTELFTLSYVFTPTLGVGVVVSKKVARRAVDRNMMRRRVYAVFRDIKHDLKTAYIVVFIKKEGAKTTYSYLKKTLDQAIQRAGLLKKDV